MLSAAQRSTTEFLQLSAPLREAAAEFRGRGLSLYTGSLIEAVCLFGEAEKYARQRDRRSTMRMQQGRADIADDLAKRRNEKGLRRLSDARDALKEVRNELRSTYADAKLTDQQLDEFYDEAREALVEGDLAADELGEVDQAFRAAIDAARGGPERLVAHVEEATRRLERDRKRGSKGNPIPWWKIGAIVCIVGVAIFAFLHCTIFGCSASRDAYIGAFTVLGLIALFC